MSDIVAAVSHLVNTILNSFGAVGNDLLHVVTAFISTVVHFVTSTVNLALSFVYQNLSLFILLAVGTVGYQLYQNQGAFKGKARNANKKLH